MYNIRDWCISRQIWWGHRIPAWYCDDCGEITVSREDATACVDCGSDALRQDTDVLDTWFSSALWPFSTMGWPEQTATLKKFYPTSCLVTGFDILFFWVARMMMMGLKFMDEVPFNEVYIHALVRDAQGQKMSKSKGNVIDPLDVIDEYGADAFRFTLTAFAAMGRDIKLSTERIAGYRNFANKLWNASRFALMNLEGFEPAGIDLRRLAAVRRRPLDSHPLDETIEQTTQALDGVPLQRSGQGLYAFTWNSFCDWYIELVKDDLYGDDPAAKYRVQRVLFTVLEQLLRLLHPIMPFITEEIWQALPGTRPAASLMLATWPDADGDPGRRRGHGAHGTGDGRDPRHPQHPRRDGRAPRQTDRRPAAVRFDGVGGDPRARPRGDQGAGQGGRAADRPGAGPPKPDRPPRWLAMSRSACRWPDWWISPRRSSAWGRKSPRCAPTWSSFARS